VRRLFYLKITMPCGLSIFQLVNVFGGGKDDLKAEIGFWADPLSGVRSKGGWARGGHSRFVPEGKQECSRVIDLHGGIFRPSGNFRSAKLGQLMVRSDGMVPEEGLEPPSPGGRKILSLLRLPVPPLGHVVRISQLSRQAPHRAFVGLQDAKTPSRLLAEREPNVLLPSGHRSADLKVVRRRVACPQ
jgi:hypothetical protein